MVQLDLLKYLHPGHLSRELMEKNQSFPLRFLHAARDNTPTEQYDKCHWWYQFLEDYSSEYNLLIQIFRQQQHWHNIMQHH